MAKIADFQEQEATENNMTSTYTILIADCTNHPYNGENIDDKATGEFPW